MKENLENSIKKSLENFEYPYNGEAWAALNARLDANTAANSGGDNSSLEDAFKSSLENHEYEYNPAAWNALKGALNVGTGVAVGAGVEEAIKTSLENHEYPYNPDAWSKLRSKLDGAKSGSLKWYIAASVVAVTAASLFFILNTNEEETSDTPVQTSEVKSSQETPEVNQVVIEQESSDPNNEQGATTTQTQNNSSENPALSNNETGQNTATVVSEPNYQNNTTTSGNEENRIQDEDVHAQNNGSEGGHETPESQPKEWLYIVPTIPSTCQGETIKIKNENSYPLTITFPNGSVWTGKSNQTTALKASIAGLYNVGYIREGEMVEKGSFMVMETPAADFEFVDLGEKYLDGLPTTEVRSATPGVKHEWKYENAVSYGTEAAPHFFSKGNHDIKLIVTASNGCKSTVTKTVTIEEDYNLMAMNSFDPTSLKASTNTFMPYALLERDVNFTMIILDPTDGHLIYQTSDASQGWDGIDRETGTLVKFETSYIWKVTIENPMPGERSDYAGIVIPVKRN